VGHSQIESDLIKTHSLLTRYSVISYNYISSMEGYVYTKALVSELHQPIYYFPSVAVS